ncbi:hypothetical protein MBLNU459_g5284t1 [Dothideomycetes sp. NU459]
MTTAERAIELVRRLNDPQWTTSAHQVSQDLQQIQLSPQGWEAANAMLADEDTSVKFYGALTLQIKLNKEGNSLDSQAADELINRILSWFIRLTCQGGRKLILDKLCSTLATYFIQSPTPWTKALRQVVCSLYAEDVIASTALESYPDTTQVIAQLSPPKLLVALRFCQVLAEDVYNGANLSPQHRHLDDVLKNNTVDVAALTYHALTTAAPADPAIQVEAISCFSAWVNYAHSNWTTDPITMQLLQNLIPCATEYLLSDREEIRDPTIDLFVGILEFRLNFLQKDQLEMISVLVRRKIGPRCVEHLHRGEQDPAMLAFGKLVTAYGKVNVKNVVQRREHDSSQEIINLFQELIRGPGYPAEDDELILSATEFWMEYAEQAVDLVVESSDADLPWLDKVRHDLISAVHIYIPKLRPPPPEVVAEWDEENMDSWDFFRDNIGDLLESVNSIPGTHLLREFVGFAMGILSTRQWLNLEAIIFCLNQISDSFENSEESREALSVLMGSSLFGDISRNSADVPARVKRAVMKLVDGYSSFIKRNADYLPPVLTFLFTTLENAAADQTRLTDTAAKSFESLCSSCRRALTPYLNELLQQCPRALSGPAANAYQKEKVMAALASVIQALPTEDAKAEPLIALIQVVEQDLNAAVAHIQNGKIEEGEQLGTTALQCLASIGKGIQAPDDTAIDVDSDSDDQTNGVSQSKGSFWTADAGSAVQQRILACFNIVSYLRNAGDAIDAACSVLRSGLQETSPGPFVFPPSATVLFVQKASIATPRIEAIITTACAFVSAHSRRNTPHLAAEILAVYTTVAGVMRALGDPANDPQLAQMCIDFLHRLLGAYIDVLLAPPDGEVADVLTFALRCMTGAAPMLKRNAANFFESLLGLASPRNPLPLPSCRIQPQSVIAAFSPSLAAALMGQIAGAAQRSELDALCKPLRAFVFGQPGARGFLEHALGQVVLGGDSNDAGGGGGGGGGAVGESEKRVFLQKVVALRGGRQTNVVVREFWALCKGTVSSFE